MSAPILHIPVLLQEVIEALQPRDGGLYVDATFGAGGYTTAILNSADCRVIAIDRDPSAIARGAAMVGVYAPRLTLVLGRFGELQTLVNAGVDGIVFDIGVSSMQIDESERGFSFRFDAFLDMRMSGEGQSAADLVNGASESELADIIYEYGEERHSRRIARAIVHAREQSPITTTLRLAEIVRGVLPGPRQPIDPATRTFQALRIAVNDELGELSRGLLAAEALLATGGRLAVVTFHSLEDRIAKNFIRARSGANSTPSRHAPVNVAARPPSFAEIGRKATVAAEGEIAHNPRARSAKLRVAERTSSPAWAEAA